MVSDVVVAPNGAIYAVLTHHGAHPGRWEGKRRKLAHALRRYSEHEVHGFLVHRARAGHSVRSSVGLLESNPACIEWEQAMGGKPIPWGHTNEVMLARIVELFRGLALSRKMAASVDDLSDYAINERRLDAKQALIGRMLA